MAKFNLKTLGLILLVSLPISSFAQSKGVQRFQIGYSFPMTKAVYTERALTQTGLDDDEVSKTVRTKGGFGITLGHFFPVAKIGQKSSLNISLDFLYNLMVWDAKMIGESEYDYTTGESDQTAANGTFDKFDKNKDRSLSRTEMEKLLGF